MRKQASRLLLASSVTALGACSPSLTTIPTYWDPVLTERGQFQQPPPVVERPPERVWGREAEELVVEVEPDTPEECLAIYVVTKQRQLLAFKPQKNEFEPLGRLECPAFGATPFSMAVARTGHADVLHTDGRIYRVGLDSLECKRTRFQRNQPPGFRLFGMAYGADDSDDGESLYVAEISFQRPSKGLGRIAGEHLEYVGRFSETPGLAIELTPTGDGPLFGFFLNEPGPGGTLVEIDTDSAEIVSSTPLNVGTDSPSLAVSWWGGFFFIFTSGKGQTNVSRYDPATRIATPVGKLDQMVVGAGVSTCAPMESRTRRAVEEHAQAVTPD